jgi:uncharacterized protein YqgV (UPF0045/DUF77 family)
MSHSVNLAIQVLPMRLSKEAAYAIVDVAIEVIQKSGLAYVVCPFETVVEGPYESVMQLLDDIQDACYKAGAPELIINMKLQRSATEDTKIDDKIGKYKE